VLVPFQHEVGDTITDSGSFGQVVCLVHFTYETLDECKETIDKIHETLLALDADGNNLLVKKLDWEKDVMP
jgi:hypothetical protein